MKEQDIQKYSHLFTYRKNVSIGLEADARIFFNTILKRPLDTCVPIAISHGVDFGHCYAPLDIRRREPIHWAYNNKLFEATQLLKSALLIPHPWVFTAKKSHVLSGSGTLVIGPPPGPENDTNLFTILKKQPLNNITILIKPRGNYRSSITYWESKGIKTHCIDGATSGSCSMLFEFINQFQYIASGTFSSILIYAATMGKTIVPLLEYTYRSYDIQDYDKLVNFTSPLARQVVATFVKCDSAEQQDIAKNLLGYDLPYQETHIREAYLQLISHLKYPVFIQHVRSGFLKSAAIHAAKLTGRRGVLKLIEDNPLQVLMKRYASIVRANEFDIWINGPNTRNLSIHTVNFLPNVTVPGNAVLGYDS